MAGETHDLQQGNRETSQVADGRIAQMPDASLDRMCYTGWRAER
jgi:hypothetical protein